MKGLTKRRVYEYLRTWVDGELFDREHESAELDADLSRVWDIGVKGGGGSLLWTLRLCFEAVFKAGYRRGKGESK